MKIKTLTDHLESLCPLSTQESYDNCGLIFGNPETEITSILVSLDCTEAVVDDAIKRGANIIISHHPLIFFKTNKVSDKVIVKAIQNNIAVYAIHTNLDHYIFGVNHTIGKLLDAKDMKFLDDKGDNTGSGMIGKVDIKLEDLYSKIEKRFGGGIRTTKALTEDIKTIAWCGGSGSFLLNKAVEQKADVYLSADFKYHEFFNDDICIIDIGHFESEQFTVNLIDDMIKAFDNNLDVIHTSVNTNPVIYR
jgi:dinuclear metal center YbgI/SA1388 family protein